MGRRVRFSGLVDGNDSELVPFALAQAGHPGLKVVDRSHAVVVVSDEGIEPAPKFVLLLNDVVANRPASCVFGLCPPEGDRFVVEVNNFGLPGGSGRSCGVNTLVQEFSRAICCALL